MPSETKERGIWIGTCFQKVEGFFFFKKKRGGGMKNGSLCYRECEAEISPTVVI